MTPQRYNLYGQGGSGKSFIGTSAIVDHETDELIAPKGLWIQIGQERNPNLHVPEANIKRFNVDVLQPHACITGVIDYLKSLQVAAAKGQVADVIFFDGYTELDILIGYVHDMQPLENDKWSEWRYRKTIMTAVTQILDSAVLGCDIITTARVGQLKKGVTDRRTGETTGADPDFVNSRYFPQMDGWMRYNLPSYHDWCFYLEVEDSINGAIHRMHLTQDGDFFIKNGLSHRWKKPLPNHLDNASFQQLKQVLDHASKPITQKEKEGVSK